MKNKNILIIVTGSIAAYKACEVVRYLRKEGANVQVMMSKSALEFVGITTFAALTGHDVITELFNNFTRLCTIFLLPLKKFSLTWNSENILWPLICINFPIL